jgi:hypothetical protein
MLHVRQSPSRRGVAARAATACALVAGLLTGCSGSLAEPDVEPAPAASYVVVNPDAVIPESDGGGRSPAATPTETPSPDPSASPVGECAVLQTAWSATNQALVSLSADHPRALVNSFRTAAESMAGIEPPEGVADDWAAMADYLERVNAALEDVDANDADAVAAAMSAAISAEDTQDASDAASRITVFLSADCQAG